MKTKDNLFLLSLNEIKESINLKNNEIAFVSPYLGIARSFKGFIKTVKSLFRFKQPYRLIEGRIMVIHSGECHIRINLQETTLTEKHIVIIYPGSVFEIIDISSDFEATILAFSNNLMEGWVKDELLQRYQQGRLFMNISATNELYTRLNNIINLIWDIVHDEIYSKDDIRSLIFLLFRQINNFNKKELNEKYEKITRQKEIFNGFISLINKYAIQKRNIAFYAEKLYITPRYLSTLIKQESGRTVMDWINDAAIQEIKLQLRHTDKLIYQIADDMNFPNSSFFTRYFHRLTGMTPKEYKEKEINP